MPLVPNPFDAELVLGCESVPLYCRDWRCPVTTVFATLVLRLFSASREPMLRVTKPAESELLVVCLYWARKEAKARSVGSGGR
jgi:hypothetical protein